jgi:hypothetical protein
LSIVVPVLFTVESVVAEVVSLAVWEVWVTATVGLILTRDVVVVVMVVAAMVDVLVVVIVLVVVRLVPKVNMHVVEL